MVFGVDSPAWRPVRLPRRRRVARAPLPARRARGARPRDPGRREPRRAAAARKPAPQAAVASAARPAPRAVRNGPGPIARVFTALARVLVTAWLGRRPRRRWGSTPDRPHRPRPRPRAPSRRCRAVPRRPRRRGRRRRVVAAARRHRRRSPARWSPARSACSPGSCRCCSASSPGATCATPSATARAGRQVIGWGALLFGVLGIVHIANGSPTPELGDTAPLQQAGGAIGFVVSKLLMDLLQTAYVVVPLLLLLALFGVLVVTATPVYQVPARLRELGDRIMGRHVPAEDEPARRPPRPIRRRRGKVVDDEIDPEMGDPAYDTPGAGGPRDRSGARRKKDVDDRPDTEPTGAGRAGPRTRSSRRRTRRCRRASSSSRCPATSPTRCPTARCSSPARCTRRARRPPTTSSSGSPRCSRSSTSTPR